MKAWREVELSNTARRLQRAGGTLRFMNKLFLELPPPSRSLQPITFLHV